MATITNPQLNALRKAEKGVFSRCSAYIILHPINPQKWGRIQACRSASFLKCEAWVWDAQGFAGYGVAKGGGYNKLDACIEGIVYDGILLTHEWERQLQNAGYTVICAM